MEELILKVNMKILSDFSILKRTGFGKQALLCFSKMKERLYWPLPTDLFGP